MTDPLVAQLAGLRARVAELENQRTTWTQATVTAVDTVGHTFSADVGGQVNGQSQSLSGIAGKPPFLPQVGDQVLLSVSGAQPVYERTLGSTVTMTGAIETAPDGQRVKLDNAGITFYPAGAGQEAILFSVDDAAGNAGVTARAGGSSWGGLNFTSTFADIGFAASGSSFASFIRVSGDPVHGVAIGVASGAGMSITTDTAIDLFAGASQFAQLGSDNSLHGMGKFSLDLSPLGAFTFGTTAGGSDADLYGSRYISTQSSGTGGFVYFSDGRLKTDIADATFDAMAAIRATHVRTFTWKETGLPGLGLIAQEAPAPAQIHLSPDAAVNGLTDPLAVSADVLMIFNWKGLQELDARLSSLAAALGVTL